MWLRGKTSQEMYFESASKQPVHMKVIHHCHFNISTSLRRANSRLQIETGVPGRIEGAEHLWPLAGSSARMCSSRGGSVAF